jgi:lysophospholipase L1-like esterase
MGRHGYWAAVAVVCAFGCGGANKSPPATDGSDGEASEAVQLIGRSQQTDRGPQFSLAGSTLQIRFEGTGLSLRLDDASQGHDPSGAPMQDAYEVLLDDAAPTVLTTSPGEASYEVASGLPNATHTVTLVKRTESMVGSTTLLGAEAEGGHLLDPPAHSNRRVEFIGDSTVSGYGDEGATPDCSFSSATENHYASFAHLTAARLSAEEISVSYSGRGVARNIDGSTDGTLPQLYGRAVLSDDKSQWNFGQWVPQVVVIDLGTNDFVAGLPDADAFVGAYEAFVRQVRGHYPDAQILVTLGPLLGDSFPANAKLRTHAREDLTRAVTELNAAGDAKVHFFEFPELTDLKAMGCDYHANVAAHAQLADAMAGALHDLMGW